MLEDLSKWVIGLGIPLMVVVFTVHFLSDSTVYSGRSQYLLITFCAISLVHSLTTASILALPFEDRFCRNNANMIDASDGFTLCALQTFVQLYFGLAICICWCMQSIGVFLKICMNWKQPPRRKAIHLSLIFGLPIPSLVAGIMSREYGYSYTQTACFFSPQARISNIDLYIFYAPVMVLTLIGAVCMLSVVGKILLLLNDYVRTQTRVRSNSKEGAPGSKATGAYELAGIPVSESPCSALGRLRSSSKIELEGVPASRDSHTPPSHTASPNPGMYGAYTPQQSITRSPSCSNSPVPAGPDPGPGGSADQPRRVRSSFWGKLSSLTQVWEIIYFLRSPLLFLSCFLLIYTSVIAIGASGSRWYVPVIRSYRGWSECVINAYDGTDAWAAVCGRMPSHRASPELRGYLSVVIGGQSLFCALLGAPGVVKILYQATKELRLKAALKEVLFGSDKARLQYGVVAPEVAPEERVQPKSKSRSSKSKSVPCKSDVNAQGAWADESPANVDYARVQGSVRNYIQAAHGRVHCCSCSEEEGKSSGSCRELRESDGYRALASSISSRSDSADTVDQSATHRLDGTERTGRGSKEFWVTEPYQPELYPAHCSSPPCSSVASRPSNPNSETAGCGALLEDMENS